MQTQFTTPTALTQTIARDDNGKFAPTLGSMKAFQKAMKADADKERRRLELEAETGAPDAYLYFA